MSWVFVKIKNINAELWGPTFSKNLLDIRDSKAVLPSFSVNEVEEMIEYGSIQ